MSKTISLKSFASLAVISAVTALTACGGGGGGSSAQGSLDVALTDGPVDFASKVMVHVTGVTVKPKGGDAATFPLHKKISLLDLQAGASSELLNDVSVQAGDYEWMRLEIDAKNSFVTLADGSEHEFAIAGASGLTMSGGFTVPEGGEGSFTIDFDLRKSMLGLSPAGYIVAPVLRLVDNRTVGKVAGSVAESLITDVDCTADANTGKGNAVYVYAGARVNPTDIGLKTLEPLSSANVSLGADYTAAWLPAGKYTVAFTCNAREDNPGTNEHIAFVKTDESINVEVKAGKTTQLDFDGASKIGDDVAVRGEVSIDLLNSEAKCDLGDGVAVYLFEGLDVAPNDLGGLGKDPVAVLGVVRNATTGLLEYGSDLLLAGNYTAALACQVDLDNPLTDDDILFVDTTEINVPSGEEVVALFGDSLMADLENAVATLDEAAGNVQTLNALKALVDEIGVTDAISSPQLDTLMNLVGQLDPTDPSVEGVLDTVNQLLGVGLTHQLLNRMRAEVQRLLILNPANRDLLDLSSLLNGVGGAIPSNQLAVAQGLTDQLNADGLPVADLLSLVNGLVDLDELLGLGSLLDLGGLLGLLDLL